jgi:SAM-dependent methyltransferase
MAHPTEWSNGQLNDSPPRLDFTQMLLAPGAAAVLGGRVAHWLERIPPESWILDLGCGPTSLIAQAGWRRVIALDRSPRHTAAVRRSGRAALVATGSQLPFPDDRFDAVWCSGMLHHVPDPIALAAMGEILRVTRPGGRVLLFDAVLPEPAWRRPLPWLVRRCDRGRYMRRQAALEALLPRPQAWTRERFTYARNGLEGLWCEYRKDAGARARASL